MEKKFELNQDLLEELAGTPILAVYLEINHLKQLYRQGWLRVGIPREQCESVAEHIFGMAMLAWLATDGGLVPGVERDRVLRMVLAHELGEIYTGDIIPADGVPAEEKHRLERAALLRVVERLPEGFDFVALWEEFEAGTSPEARLARQLDRLEMVLQALVYEKQGHTGPAMGGFYHSAAGVVQDERLQALLEVIQARRDVQSNGNDCG